MLPLMMLIYVTILIILMPFSKQACGRPTWSLRATWCPRAPCWWLLLYSNGCTINLRFNCWTHCFNEISTFAIDLVFESCNAYTHKFMLTLTYLITISKKKRKEIFN